MKKLNFYRAAAGLFFVGALGAYVWNFYSASVSSQPTTWGVFGDYFGGVLNPALSFLGLLALLETIMLQKEELVATRKELEETRAVASAQLEQIKRQDEFDMLWKVLQDIANEIESVMFENIKTVSGEHPLRSYIGPVFDPRLAIYLPKKSQTLSGNTMPLYRLEQLFDHLVDQVEKPLAPQDIKDYFRRKYQVHATHLKKYYMLDDKLTNFFCVDDVTLDAQIERGILVAK